MTGNREHRARHAIGEGPALSASTVQVAHDTGGPAHPAYFGVPASLGFASILGVPLDTGTGGAVALDLYARPGNFFAPDRQRIALIIGRQIGTSVELMLRAAWYQRLTSAAPPHTLDPPTYGRPVSSASTPTASRWRACRSRWPKERGR